ncbi:MAG: hypothetical protein ACLQVY_26625 [Limisphaerales bacterium]
MTKSSSLCRLFFLVGFLCAAFTFSSSASTLTLADSWQDRAESQGATNYYVTPSGSFSIEASLPLNDADLSRMALS